MHQVFFIPKETLSEFHGANPFEGNFCEVGQALFAEKKMEFPS